MTMAALEATLHQYRYPELLTRDIPTLRLLTRPAADIQALAQRLLPPVQHALAAHAQVEIRPCHSQIGSGSLPVDRLPSTCLAITPAIQGRGAGTALNKLAAAFRALPRPVVGRMEDGAMLFDLRCLEDETTFIAQLKDLAL